MEGLSLEEEKKMKDIKNHFRVKKTKLHCN